MFICSSHDYVLFFTTKGRVYRKKCYEIPEGSRTSKGTNIVNILPLEADEKVASMIRVPAFEDGQFIVFVTRKGIIKRTELNAYNTTRKGGVIALTINDGDELAWVRLTNGNNDLIVGTKEGIAIRFNENDVRPMGRSCLLYTSVCKGQASFPRIPHPLLLRLINSFIFSIERCLNYEIHLQPAKAL